MTETENAAQRQRRVGDDEEIDDPAAEAVESPSEEMQDAPPSKKRRRGAKANSEKKFECKHEGCNKSYSRAEHLYRHQLNHTPKNIYRCDYPECNRYFVRQDLCLRHRDRHTTNGSQLHKRDVFAQSTTNQSPIAAAPTRRSPTSVRQISGPLDLEKHISSSNPRRSPQHFRHSTSKSEENSGFTGARQSGSTASASSASVESRFRPSTPQAIYHVPTPAIHRSSSSSGHPLSPHQQQVQNSSTSLGRQGSFCSTDDLKHETSLFQSTQDVPYDGRPTPTLSPTRTYSSSSQNNQAQYFDSSPLMTHAGASSHGHPFNQNAQVSTVAMGSYTSQSSQNTSTASFAAAVSRSLSDLNPPSAGPYVTMPDDSLGMDMAGAYAYPVFGSDEYNRSPNAMGDDFAAWFFNENQSAALGYPPTASVMPGLHENGVMPFPNTYYPMDPSSISIYPDVAPPQHAMSLMNIVDSSGTIHYAMSEEKRQELLDLMQMQFNERPHDAVKKRKDAVFEGDVNAENHILSLRMMHTYVGSYWYHQHAQLPILHKPTFTADKTPNLLLLMVIAIGAATMDKAYGTSLTDSAAEFANFVVWHVRWEIMRDADYRPPAKLWIFQTLLLIEIYEKMYATRALHERGHINHDSLLTLMRRGSSLTGRPAFDSPPSLRDDKTARSSGSNSATDTPGTEETWARWIRTEATRRAAFAAFVIDSIHATMFGHNAKMVAHEMRLPLPCDEGLWSATSAAEVARVQSSLQTNGIKPTLFLEGLKKTLNGHRVLTNSFGRTILMAGLLSVSWHMNQKDLSLTTLGASTFGGRDKWRGLILRAFDNWKRDFDEALIEATATSPDYPTPLSRSLVPRPIDDENIFESRTVLHHLAHMASHVDIVDCQIFAGASHLLGRSITPKDYSNVRERITERWATRASARDAAFYALKFLAQVLIPPYEGDRFGHASSPILPLAFDQNQYYARDDFLLNRPWVLYFSALVVWCYGYALEGPINPTPLNEQFATAEQRDKDMREYLDRVGGIRAPDDLEAVKGKNRCLGLLLILKESFSLTRWELTREAANLLGNCINKLKGMDGAGAMGTY